MDIIIDTKGDEELAKKSYLLNSDDDDVNFEDIGSNSIDTEAPSFFDIEADLLENERTTKKIARNASKDIDLEEFEKDMGWSSVKRRREIPAPDLVSLKQELTPVDK
ncbi:hypothetical protein ANTPLA_LOCUS6537 [Anthophora plagiata]